VLWLIVRVAGIFLGIGSFSPPEVVVVSLLILLLIWVDILAFREPLLLANMAISPLQISWIVLSSAVALDLVAALSFGASLRHVVGN
jgi:hypothetical protein